MRRKMAIAGSLGLMAGLCVPLAMAQIAPPASVETTQLATDAFAIGGLDAGETALPNTLWEKSDPQTLDFLLSYAPSRPASPSLGQALRRTLLSPGAKPAGAGASLGGKKLLALARAGFINEAQTVASLATSGKNDLFVAEAEATLSLLDGDADGACRRGAGLTSGREVIFWVRLRAFCYARAGELDAFDLTMNLLRERGAISSAEEALFLSAATRVPPKAIPPISTALQYAALKAIGADLNPALLSQADGGVLAAFSADLNANPALRIEAAEQAIALGVKEASSLKGLFTSQQFEVADLASVMDQAAAHPADPLIDAMLYQSITEMTAPEFIRDKAQRISFALSRADSFSRAYALSHLYAEEISSLEGVLVSPEEAEHFALAAMATGDSVGAGRWLTAMIGANESVAALPEKLGVAFIDRVNLLALLDPQTASRIARSAGVSLLADDAGFGPAQHAHEDPAVTARILEAAFDAVADGKSGQAGLAALAASSGGGANGGEVESVIVSEGLRAAGMPELSRRNRFEQAWAASFSQHAETPSLGGAASGGSVEAMPAAASSASQTEGGITPRIKPRGQ
ncbi:hypothetical protein [Hyphococcus sp.]|uniref:hypothetical protein n=1 Tax=Hyphococcus sp. TaxID=2038636 RepID=UPI0037508600